MGKNFKLREYRESDMEMLMRMRNDLELQFFLLVHPTPNSPEQVRSWIERKINSRESIFFVISGMDDTPAGFMQATEIDYISRVCKIGAAVDKNMRGKGVFKESLYNIEGYLAGTLNIRKIVGELLVVNESSAKGLKSAGYVKAGVLKEQYYNSGTYYDVALYEKFTGIQ